MDLSFVKLTKELCKRKRRAAGKIKILSQKSLKSVIKFSYSRELDKVLLVKVVDHTHIY